MEIFKGVGTAIVTPFTADTKEINYKQFARLVDYQIKGGVSTIIFLGTTGESSCLSSAEKTEVISWAVRYVNKRVKVVAGAGSNNTAVAVSQSKEYEKLGADALLHITPYYNKCTQKGLIEHYKAIAKSTKLPIILYNVPGRTAVNILPETVKELSKIKNIVAIKEASGNLQQIEQVSKLITDKFKLYSGDDGIIYDVLDLGGSGVISVVSNVLPEKTCEICNRFFKGDKANSKALQERLNPFIKLLFSEVNPIPIKQALNEIGFKVGKGRLPLTAMEKENKEILIKELKTLK